MHSLDAIKVWQLVHLNLADLTIARALFETSGPIIFPSNYGQNEPE
jgi:hypothetical protein